MHHHRLVNLVRKLEPDTGLVLAKPDDSVVSVRVPEKRRKLVLTRPSKISSTWNRDLRYLRATTKPGLIKFVEQPIGNHKLVSSSTFNEHGELHFD